MFNQNMRVPLIVETCCKSVNSKPGIYSLRVRRSRYAMTGSTVERLQVGTTFEVHVHNVIIDVK